MSILRRHWSIPLEPPPEPGHYLPVPNLSDTEVLRHKRLSIEAGDFALEASRLAGSGQFDTAAASILQGPLASATAAMRQSPGGQDEAMKWARLGLAAAALDQTRGWSRPGRVDARVHVLFGWGIGEAGLRAEGVGELEMATFVAEAAYYLSRTGGRW